MALEHGADYTLEGVTITIPIKMDNSTYILTAARDNNSVGIIDISDPKMPKQVALFEDDLNLGLHSAHSIETISINGRTYALVGISWRECNANHRCYTSSLTIPSLNCKAWYRISCTALDMMLQPLKWKTLHMHYYLL